MNEFKMDFLQYIVPNNSEGASLNTSENKEPPSIPASSDSNDAFYQNQNNYNATSNYTTASICSEVDSTFYRKQQEAFLQVQCDAAKNANHVNAKLLFNERLADQCEAETERRKAVYEVVLLDENGKLTVFTKNTRKDYGERNLANFDNPQMTIVQNVTTKEKGYIISFSIGKQKKYVFLHERRAGDAAYILKKLHSVGADFLTDKNVAKKKYVTQMMSLLLRRDNRKIEVPVNSGWFKTSEDKIVFCKKGALTWDILIRSL